MKKVILVDKNSGNSEFVAKHKATKNSDLKITLKTSKSDVWSDYYKDTTVIKLIDDGNGCTIKLTGEKSMMLDYSQVAELYLILNELVEETNLTSNYERLIKKNKK